MPLLPRLVSFCRTIFHGGRLDRDLDDELEQFVEARTAFHRARGLPEPAARREARLDLGGLDQVRERVREGRIGWRLETTWRDVRFGARMMTRAPGFTALVVGTLALVTGANATVFSVAHAVLWRELPYPRADRLVVVDADAQGIAGAGISDAEAVELRDESHLFDGVGFVFSVNAHVDVGDRVEWVPAASVSGDALDLLGARPLAFGRALDPSRDVGADGYARAVVISHRLWRTRFDGDPSIIGRRIEVNNLDVAVAGVLREDFRLFLPAAMALPEVPDVWFPRPYEPHYRAFRSGAAIARLAPDITHGTARVRLAAIAARLLTDHPGDYSGGRFRLRLRPLHEEVTAGVRPALVALTGAVGVVLLIGCVNVGSLMLARGRARATEMALRRALGAGRGRLACQLLTETALLVLLGAGLGLLLAHAGVGLLEWLRPGHLPRQSQVAVNGAVVLFTVALSMAVTLALGLLPSLARSARGAQDTLRSGRADVQHAGAQRLQRALVVAGVALCIVPLAGGALMLRSFVNLIDAPLGFAPDGLLTARVPLSLRQYPDRRQRQALLLRAIEEVGRIPGVRGASVGGPLPFDHQFTRAYGRVGDAPSARLATVQSVFPGYLALTGVLLEEGRDFSREDLDAGRRVVIVDGRIARQLWPEGAVGQHLAIGQDARAPRTFEVIGVTGPVRAMQVRDAAMPHLFVPYDEFGLLMSLVVRTGETAAAIGPAIGRTVAALGTRRPIYDVRPMRAYVDDSLREARFLTILLAAFGLTGLALAGVGLYGTLAWLTSRRRQEFGVRLALGATASSVLRGVLGEGLLLAGLGAALGLCGALAAGWWLQGLLYDVTPHDVPTLLAVCAAVVGVALTAIAHPALRAARTDPAAVLRAE